MTMPRFGRALIALSAGTLAATTTVAAKPYPTNTCVSRKQESAGEEARDEEDHGRGSSERRRDAPDAAQRRQKPGQRSDGGFAHPGDRLARLRPKDRNPPSTKNQACRVPQPWSGANWLN